MEINKAIEILTDNADHGLTAFDADFIEAIRMGRDALTYVQKIPVVRWNSQTVAARAGNIQRQETLKREAEPAYCCQDPSCGSIIGKSHCRNCDAPCTGCFHQIV